MTKLIDITGKAISGEWGNDDTTGTGIPVLRTTNFTNDGVINFESVVTRSIVKQNLKEKYLQKGDIIIEKSGGSTDQPVGRVVYFDAEEHKYLFNNFTGVLRVRNKDKWFPRYVFWSLYYNYRIGGTKPYQNKTTGLHNLQTDQYVRDTVIHEFDISEQRRIAGLLDKTDELICLRKKQLQKLDDLIKSRFVEMFGRIKENEKHWNKMRLKDVAEVRGRVGWKGYKREDLRQEGPLVLGATHLTENGEIDLSSPVYLSREKYEESPEIMLQRNDLIFTQRGNTIGKVGLVADNIGEATINPCVLILRPVGINPVFFKIFFLMKEVQSDMWKLNSGSAQPMITQQGIGNYLLAVPPNEIQNDFSEYVLKIYKSKPIIMQSLDKLEQMKQALMQKYFG